MITATFWLLPSLLWKKSDLLGLTIPGSQPSERLEAGQVDLSPGAEAEERLGGVVTALVDSGLGDIYNRVLCPTCIMQIVIINTMVVSRLTHSRMLDLTIYFTVCWPNAILDNHLLTAIKITLFLTQDKGYKGGLMTDVILCNRKIVLEKL